MTKAGRRALMAAAATAASALPAISATAQDETRLLRDPALSEAHVAFVYAGDIWVADRDGSDPRRLTSHPATETGPVFSPDGSMIAFNASYEDNTDVYVVPVEGGQPRRLTWHPGADTVLDWSPDGDEVAFASARERLHGRSAQLYHVSLEGGLPTKQMEARVVRGAYDADASHFAYHATRAAYNGLYGGTAGWRGYRGGASPTIWVMDMRRDRYEEIPGDRVNDINPMWVGEDVYFVSDREDKVLNIFRYSRDDRSITKVSSEAVWDIRAADAHGSTIVYEAGGQLKLMDAQTGATTPLSITIAPDLPQRRAQWKSAARTIQNVALSTTGKRAVITARGDVFTVPVEDGSTRNITDTNGVREYTALWSPGGGEVAYISDEGGAHNLVIADQTGAGDVRRYPLGADFYSLLEWGGEGERILFTDNKLGLFAIAVDGGEITRIATGERREGIEASTSPDGRYVAYTRERANYLRDLLVFDFETGRSTPISDGMADVAMPAFSPDGQYLYFAASTNTGPFQVGLDMSSQERPYRAGLYAVVLAADGVSPILPGAGDEEPTSDEADEGKEEDESDEDASSTVIDFDAIADRITALPVAERSYDDLAVAHDGNLYFMRRVQPGAQNTPPGQSAAAENALMRFNVEDREVESVLSGVNGFTMSADAKHMLIAFPGGRLAVAKVADKLDPENLDLSGVRMYVDPREEWAHIFDEAWRMQQAYFYDPNAHGLDWDAVYARYRPLVDHVGRREDLNELIVEMIAELQAGHNRAGGGDVHDEAGTSTGLLGADLIIADGRHRIARIFDGERWNPFVNAPLAEPGLGVSEGDYILAVNGRALEEGDNIFAALQGTAGEQTTLTIASNARGRGSRDIVVTPASSEGAARLWHWIEANRRAVDEATDGRVGYVYLPNTGGAGYTFFNRMFFAQVDKEAIIIDERSNGGGQAANYITDVLSRTHLAGWKDFAGLEFTTPGGAIHGPKVMLIDQDAGSGGDFLPYAFREMGIGTLIGTRTWGGLIGISTNPSLIDGGFMTVPYFRFFDTDRNWSVENEGVAPDIEVVLDPIATNEGRDTQLERAIAEVLAQLEDFTPTVNTQAPPYPTELGR